MRLAAVGDMMPGYADQAPLVAGGDVAESIRHADLFLMNFEATIGGGPPTRPERAFLQTSSAHIASLPRASTNVACLANNHVTDAGPIGLQQTAKALEEHGFHTIGAGQALNRALQPLRLVVQGVGCTILARASTEPWVGAVQAGTTAPGVAPLEEAELLAVVRGERATGQVVIVLLHWGVEHYHYPAAEQVGFARKLIDSGATVVVGHHPHVLQGYERYGNGVILYSLGNFWFPPLRTADGKRSPWSADARQTALVQLKLSVRGVERVGVIPFSLDESGIPSLASENAGSEILARLDRWSAPLRRGGYGRFERQQRLRHVARRVAIRMGELGVGGVRRKLRELGPGGVCSRVSGWLGLGRSASPKEERRP